MTRKTFEQRRAGKESRHKPHLKASRQDWAWMDAQILQARTRIDILRTRLQEDERRQRAAALAGEQGPAGPDMQTTAELRTWQTRLTELRDRAAGWTPPV